MKPCQVFVVGRLLEPAADNAKIQREVDNSQNYV